MNEAFLDVDPYADTAWTRDRLTELTRLLLERRDACRRAGEKQVLLAHGRRALEPWMGILVDRALAANAEHTTLGRVLVLAEDAERRGATLAFEAIES